MRSNDIMNREEIRAQMQSAIKENDTDAFYGAFDKMLGCIEESIMQSYEEKINDMKQEFDHKVLASRGVRQLTSEERARRTVGGHEI